METSFPLTALESEQHLSPPVQIAEPFRIFLILEMSPHVVVKLHEPVETLLVSGELITLDHADC